MSEPNTRVLVVDHDVSILKQVREELVTMLFCEVDTTPNPEYAFELFLKQHYDLLIFDFNLPEINGSLLYSLIRKVSFYLPGKKLPPLLMMNDADNVSQKRMADLLREPGVRGVIAKPIDSQWLIEKVNALLLEIIS